MANTFYKKFSSNVGTTTTTVGDYTVGSDGAVVIGLNLCNQYIQTVTVDVFLSSASSYCYYLLKGAPILAGGTLVLVGGDQKIVIQPGDRIRVKSSAASSLDVIMTIMETNAVGTGDDGPVGGFYEMLTQTPLTLPSNITQTTSQYNFGTSSLYFNGSATDNLNFDTTAFNYDGTGYITVECWVRIAVDTSVTPVNLPFYMINTSTNQALGARVSSGSVGTIGSDTSGGNASGGNVPGISVASFAWRHVGMTFNASGAGWWFSNGTVSAQYSTSYNQANKNRIAIGGSGNISGFPYYVRDCYVDDIRVSYGKRYGGQTFGTTSYSVPTSRLTIDATTVALFQSR